MRLRGNREAEVHVVVVGCGRVGSELTGLLEAAGHTVSIVDKLERSFRRLPDTFSGERIVGLGFDADVLREAGIEKAGALASVTSGDNSNILIARVARETFGLERVVARIYDPRRAEIYQRVGIPTVATVAWATDQVMRRLFPDDVPHDWMDATAGVCLVERTLPDHWAGHPARALELGNRIRVVSLTRYGVARLVDHDTVLQQGDIVHVIMETSAQEDLARLLAGPVPRVPPGRGGR